MPQRTPEELPTQRLQVDVPKYIDPVVLRPGQLVRVMLWGADSPALRVLRVEPHLWLLRDDGEQIEVPAHACQPVAPEDIDPIS